jgi:hypothetical protein
LYKKEKEEIVEGRQRKGEKKEPLEEDSKAG